MKKFTVAIVVALVAILMVSCEKTISFNASFLIGLWETSSQSSSAADARLYYRYGGDYLGATWDTGDDVTEHEAQMFEWELNGEVLTQYHLGEMGQKIPKEYILKTLTPTSLVYVDDLSGKEYRFTKVAE